MPLVAKLNVSLCFFLPQVCKSYEMDDRSHNAPKILSASSCFVRMRNYRLPYSDPAEQAYLLKRADLALESHSRAPWWLIHHRPFSTSGVSKAIKGGRQQASVSPAPRMFRSVAGQKPLYARRDLQTTRASSASLLLTGSIRPLRVHTLTYRSGPSHSWRLTQLLGLIGVP